MHDLRIDAISKFDDLGFPTARRGNEEWKYTDVGPIASTSFQFHTAHVPEKVSARNIGRYAFGSNVGARLVFLDGRYSQSYSFSSLLPKGVSVMNLAEAIETRGDLVERYLAQEAEYSSSGFTALNTAFIQDGAFVHVPANTVVEEPIQLLFLTLSKDQERISQPRVLIVADENSSATVLETHAGITDNKYFANGVTEVVVGPGASLKHYRVQRQSEQAFHVGTTRAELGRDSRYTSVAMDVGSAIARNNLHVLMSGEGCSCSLNGLYVVAGSQHVDNEVIIDHAVAHTSSRELYKGILDGRSRAVFHGSIIVRKNAQKVDAQQADKNLLLSDQAEADTKPAFWIYADDVKCGHGAASGKLDENALFYLRSRGLDQETARRLLIRAFAKEIIDSVRAEPVRGHLDRLLTKTLSGLQFNNPS